MGLNLDIAVERVDDNKWTVQVRPAESPEEPIVYLYSQRDPRWKNAQLGFGSSTIGSFGCLITCVAMMVSHALQEEITPPMVNDALKVAGGYTGPNKNLMYFSKVWEIWPQLRGIGIYDWHTIPADLSKVDDALEQGGYVLTKIDFVPGGAVNEHWVLIAFGGGDQYVIYDPWDGASHWLPPAYCKETWDAARAIFKVSMYSSRAVG
jgi:hypothetical protein